jgi:membrane protease YdiL (CAAX protease family)
MQSKSMKKIITFLGITLAISAVFYAIIIRAGTLMAGGGIYVLGLMWAPGIAGIVTQLIFERTLRGMGWKPGKFKYLLLAYLIPLAYCLAVYGITWLTGLGKVPNPTLMDQLMQGFGGLNLSPLVRVLYYCFYLATVGVITALISSLGEEIGWRGLLVPELAKVTSFRNASLISGAVWTLWHLPLILFADYNLPGVPQWYAAVMFAVMVVGISFAFAYLRIKSGSLWTAVVMHSSHNVFVQSIFTPLTEQTAVTPYIIDEFGVGLALAAVIVAIIFLRKGKELDAAPASS